jgi:hypothetical protein
MESADPLVLTLRAMQAAADNQKSSAPMSWEALNQAGQQYGAPDIDYRRFAARWDSQAPEDQILKKLVDKFDGTGLVIKTQNSEGNQPEVQGQQKTSGVDQMAMAATKRAFN